MDRRVETPARAGRIFADLPGPSGWPLLGNLPQLDPARIHAQLEEWSRTWGWCYRLRLGPRDIAVISRPDVIATILRDRPDGWRRARVMADVIREMGAHGLFSAEGDDWRRQRLLVMKAFDPANLKRYFPSLVRVTGRLRAQLDDHAARDTPVDLQGLLTRYTVDVVAGLAFGVDVNTLEQPGDALRAHLNTVFPMLMRRMNAPFPWWRYVRLPSDRAFDRHLAAVHGAVHDFVARAEDRIARDPGLAVHPANLLEAMLAARDADGRGLTREEIVGNVLTVLLAGEDTTSHTLAWALYHLNADRGAWDALVTHVDAVLGDAPLPPDVESTRALGFIEDCVHETMRLRPVGPIVFLESNRDVVLDDVRLPRDTLVVCLMRPGAVDPAVAPDAAVFRPSRWREDGAGAPPDDPAAHGDARALTKASMPFGAGPRLCPGRYLALLEMKMVLATLARNYTLVDVSGDGGAPPLETLAFTMAPTALRMRIARRAHASDGRC